MDKNITIDPKRLYTKSEYHKKFGINRVRIDYLIKTRELKTIEVQGTTLIIVK